MPVTDLKNLVIHLVGKGVIAVFPFYHMNKLPQSLLAHDQLVRHLSVVR